MSCAACSARVEKAVSKVPGVTAVSVSLLTNSMGVEGTASAAEIISAVEKAGYHAAKKDGTSGAAAGKAGTAGNAEELEDHETPKMIRRLVFSVVFSAALMYISMGHMMWGWPLPSFFAGNMMAIALAQMLLAITVMVINQKFFISGFRGLIHRAPNMDTLVSLGSGAAFVYSTVVLFRMTGAQTNGDMEMVHQYLHDLYFESAAVILALITVGKTLEAYSKGRTTDALKSLMKLAPKNATLLINGQEQVVPIEQVKKGDLFVVRPGENIPVDGIVVKGHGAVNESALTGESIPVDKIEGDQVSAATINQEGFLTCEALRVGEDTTLSQIIQMVSDAAATKAPIAKVVDKVSGVFVPVVITIAVIAAACWLLAGESFAFALARGISVLVISCPCALGLATPVAIMVGNGMGAKNGILFKNAVSLEETGKAEIVVFDKTGTITQGEPKVTDLLPAEGVTEDQLLSVAAALEGKSEHPLAKAVIACAADRQVRIRETEEFQAVPGNGLSAVLDGKKIAGGKAEFISGLVGISPEVQRRAEQLAGEGKTPLYFTEGGVLLGCIAVADVIKEDSPQAVSELKKMGIHVVMLTGDHEKTAQAIGRQAGVNEIIANVLPSGKEEQIRRLKEQGKVIMVGDGINDAPALTRADIGIAIGAGTDVAVDAADVVLMKSSLADVPAAIRLSRAVLRNIHENLFWAFIYNTIGIPLAAGIWIPIFGWKLNPMFGAAAMGMSSFCVVSNALRLNLFDIRSTKYDKAVKKSKKKKESKTMEKTMKIEGMMCGHCEMAVKKALEAVDGVTEAVVSHTAGTAVVKLAKAVDDAVLVKAVEDKDYKVKEVA